MNIKFIPSSELICITLFVVNLHLVLDFVCAYLNSELVYTNVELRCLLKTTTNLFYFTEFNFMFLSLLWQQIILVCMHY